VTAAGDITAAVEDYRARLGPDNGGEPGHQPFGRREINWDAVPDEFAAPNILPGDFFNAEKDPRARGARLETPGDHVAVSADESNPDAAPVRFGDVNPSYVDAFRTFSEERLFSPVGSNVVDLTFFVAGTQQPALVRGFGAILDGPHPQLLLEYAEGPTLHQLIDKHGPLPPEQLAPLALHVASVLQYLAGQRVVHLDVKPGNIVMGLPPRLIDLSIARGFDEAAQLRVPIGTDRYMAPEQCDPLSSPAPVGPATDVWGFGATLYQACTGYAPFGRVAPAPYAGPLARFPQLVREPPPLPMHLPARLAEVIRRMLRKDPAGRPSLRDVVAALEPLVPEQKPNRRLAR
jgi:serine/threonine protein kinase